MEKNINLEFVNVDCILCGSSDHKAVLNLKTNIVKCKNCGMMYTNPQIRETKNREIISEQGDMDIVRYNALKHWEIPRFNEELIKIEKKVKPGRILDVGCGNGNFMSCAKSRGWEAHGVDLNPASQGPCSEYGAVSIGTIQDAKYPDNFFDAIFSSSTFCYFTDPLAFFREAMRVLKPGGVITITGIPNIKSLEARINLKFYIEPYLPEQVSYYFDRVHLKKLVTKSGLEIIKIKTPGIGRMFLRRTTADSGNSVKTEIAPAVKMSGTIPARQKFAVRSVRNIINGVLNLFSLGYHLTLSAKKPG